MNATTKLLRILSIASISLVPVCQSACAAEVAGHVQFVLGNVQATTAEGQTHALKKGDAVNEGDTVSTAVTASAQIKMNDGGFIAVRPDTKMKFEKFVFKGTENGKERSFFALFKGGFRAVTGLIGKTNKQNYRITTSAATIGIRGTDHETYFVPEGSKLAPPGVYSKVNLGETTITTNRGTISVLPNQMGFASGMNELPKLAPVNTNIFTVSTTPAKPIKENKADKSNQADTGNGGGATQTAKQEAKSDTPASNGNAGSNTGNVAANTNDTASTSAPLSSSDSTATANNNTPLVNTAPTTTLPDNLTPTLPPTIVPIVLTNAATGTTLNVTTQTNTQGGVTTAFVAALAYPSNQIALETVSAFNYGYNNQSGMLVAPSGLTYVAGGSSASGALQAYIQQNIGGGSNWTSSSAITGGTANSFNAPSFASTGIQYGTWAGYTGQSFTNNFTLGGNNGGGQTNWMYAPQGYVDTANWGTGTAAGTLAGTFTYQLAASTNAPRYQNSGVSGTLSSASIIANFAAMTVSANLGLNIGTDNWGASLSGVPISSNFGVGGSFGSTNLGANGGTWTVYHGATTTTPCPSCSGNLNGMFTGLDFSGALFSYSLYDSTQSSSVYGDAAFNQPAGVTPGGASTAPGTTIVETGPGSLNVVPTGTVFTSANGVLTQYISSNVSGGVSNVSTVTVSCLSCLPAGSTAGGIYWGNWTSGTFASTSSTSISGGSANPAYWITGPEAGPLYLPQALTGTATYSLDAGQVSNSAGVAGTVNGTTALTLNFTNQTVGINLNATVTDANAANHNWIAQSAATPLVGNQGIGGGAFHASTSGGSNSGSLTVTVDGSITGNGSIDGQLTGSGLTGAIISFSLSTPTTGSYVDTINGIAAFSGATQNVNTPYQSVLMTTYDPSTQVPSLGFYFNNTTRTAYDAAGNLTQFDTNYVNSGSGGNVTMTNTGSTLTDFGTDPVSGISWGRWSGGTLNVTNRATGAVTSTPLSGSLHWITEPISTSAVTLPVSGSYTYTLAGGTRPTDSAGNIGILNSASVTANFTAQTVNLGVNASVAGTTLSAAAANAPIIQNTVFYASSTEPSTSSSYLNVSCTGTCSGTTGGTVIGKFTGAGAVGVAMAYGLQNGTSVINGVAALHR